MEVKKAGYKKTLVVGPRQVIYTSWPDEASLWDDFKDLKLEIFHGRNPLDIRTSTADIILVNFEYVPKMVNASRVETRDFAKFYGFDGIVIDELTAYKSTKSKRFREMRNITPGMKFRWGLTGSPVANRLEDIFGQAQVIDNGRQFGPYVTHFRNKYFRPSGYGGYKLEIQSDAARDEIYEKIGKLGLRLSAEDYLQMPKLIENLIRVNLPEKVEKAYKQVEKDFVTILNDEVVTAASKAAALNKCRQIAGGSVYVPGESGIVYAHEEKLEALGTLYEELQGEQLLVYVGFRSEAEAISKRFKASVIIGGTPISESSKTKKLWDEKKVGMLVAHPSSFGRGLNLQHGGNHLCWYTLPWDYELYDQSNRRLYRQGQEKTVTIHKLMAWKTIDWYVNKVLTSKHEGQESVFDYLKREMNYD